MLVAIVEGHTLTVAYVIVNVGVLVMHGALVCLVIDSQQAAGRIILVIYGRDGYIVGLINKLISP